jgi:hypothetical protein
MCCQNCRCFVSSLREITTISLDTAFTRRGRCYLSNCYRHDYLQVLPRGDPGIHARSPAYRVVTPCVLWIRMPFSCAGGFHGPHRAQDAVVQVPRCWRENLHSQVRGDRCASLPRCPLWPRQQLLNETPLRRPILFSYFYACGLCVPASVWLDQSSLLRHMTRVCLCLRPAASPGRFIAPQRWTSAGLKPLRACATPSSSSGSCTFCWRCSRACHLWCSCFACSHAGTCASTP